MPLMLPINKIDMQWLKNKFVNGYRNGDCVVYIAMYNNKNQSLDISNNISDL